jgi:hypothetical protein
LQDVGLAKIKNVNISQQEGYNASLDYKVKEATAKPICKAGHIKEQRIQQ